MADVINFSFMVFVCDSSREKVIYWLDGKKTKNVMKKDKFLDLALSINDGSLYSKIFDASNTYSYYMWNTIDNKLIHLTQKIEGRDNLIVKNTLMIEIGNLKKDKTYRSGEKKPTITKELSLLTELGFEVPSFENIEKLTQSFSPRKSLFSFLG